MKEIEITAESMRYKVVISGGILPKIGELISPIIKSEKLLTVTDDNVDGLYSEQIIDSLKKSGYDVYKCVIPHGEMNKSINTVERIAEYMAEIGMTRSDSIIALGGGIVGDISGFCAATYLRGIKYVQIPTTLLAMIDSSVGGKTAVNLRHGKNLLGAFWQPSYVLCDYDCLKTLPKYVIEDGMAEVIKYDIISGEEFADDTELMISRCIEIKNEYVTQDEFDTGQRQILNLGHTFGHAVEKCSDYAVSHGHAVAVGMMIAIKISEKLNILEDKNLSEKLKKSLIKYNLPYETDIDMKLLLEIAKRDKKRADRHITLVLPKRAGACVLSKIEINELEKVLSNENFSD